MPKHHPVFEKFGCWKGEVKPRFSVNFLGIVTRDHFFIGSPQNTEQSFLRTRLPNFDEEYFEWIDLLEAVISAKQVFTMIELGAGYGRWLANAVGALRSGNNASYKLIGVEPEPTHYKWMKVHLRDNEVDLRKCRLIKAAATKADGSLWFYVGRPAEWYGQAIAPAVKGSFVHRTAAWLTRKSSVDGHEVRKVRAVSLNNLLRKLQKVDLIDLDVQGAELGILEASSEQLSAKVSRVHIGTHSREIEEGLRALFRGLGWENLNDYGCNCECETPYGPIKFQDGVQTWVNSNTAVRP